jgi:DNA-binding NtrC family response regulator
MKKEFSILIVDDEKDYCDVLGLILESEGYQVTKCNIPKDALSLVQQEPFDLVLSDLIMPEMDGVALLKEVKKLKPDLCFIIMTAYGTIENAVTAMKEGAYSYTIKGADPEELLKEISDLVKIKGVDTAATEASKQADNEFMLETKNPIFRELLSMAAKAAKSDANVLILGESGAGKEVLAQYIHKESRRNNNPFIATNCYTFTESLLESELFGHEKGAFTGALTSRVGRFEAASGGTLFLDEIGDIPLPTQSKLLRAIETKTINRIGRNEDIKVDFRLIAATNKNLEKEIKEGRFREDLYYRLSTIVLEVPPLRERKEDLPAILQYFLDKTQRSLGIPTLEIPPAVMDLLLNYSYPGNIRELKNTVERMAVLSDNGKVNPESLSNLISVGGPADEIQEIPGNPDDPEGSASDVISLKRIKRDAESKCIANALKKNNNNVSRTAQELGISTRQLFNKITEYGLKGTE